jgi:DNA-binding MarR family transcriptional regulator
VAKPRDLVPKDDVFSTQPRFSIMLLLYFHQKVGFTELQKLLELTPGNLDHHIRKLEGAGFVKTCWMLSWRPLKGIEITKEGAQKFREYAIKLKELLESIK